VEDVVESGKKKKKKDKVRSAWIGFVGRIVAQLVGAIATVALGVMVLSRYTAPARPAGYPDGLPGAPATLGLLPAGTASFATYSEPAVTIIVIAPHAPDRAGKSGEHERPASDAAARQAEVANAIAKAMSAPLPRID
jgi:hypothetical protein